MKVYILYITFDHSETCDLCVIQNESEADELRDNINNAIKEYEDSNTYFGGKKLHFVRGDFLEKLFPFLGDIPSGSDMSASVREILFLNNS